MRTRKTSEISRQTTEEQQVQCQEEMLKPDTEQAEELDRGHHVQVFRVMVVTATTFAKDQEPQHCSAPFTRKQLHVNPQRSHLTKRHCKSGQAVKDESTNYSSTTA